MVNQSDNIAKKIDEYLNDGMEDKQAIYTKVVEELGVPRPTVRRVAGDLRNTLESKIRILEKEIVGSGYHAKRKSSTKHGGY